VDVTEAKALAAAHHEPSQAIEYEGLSPLATEEMAALYLTGTLQFREFSPASTGCFDFLRNLFAKPRI